MTRAFLVPGEVEQSDLGVYGYLLFGSPPAHDEARRLYLAALEAYFDIPRLEDAAVYADPWELSVTHVPVTERPPRSVSEFAAGRPGTETRTSVSEWTLAHYDYARAADLLRRASRAAFAGPFIVATLGAPGEARLSAQSRLYVDLSPVPPELASAWVQHYLKRSTQPEPWDDSVFGRLALELRTYLRVTAEAWPSIRSVAEDLVSLTGTAREP